MYVRCAILIMIWASWATGDSPMTPNGRLSHQGDGREVLLPDKCACDAMLGELPLAVGDPLQQWVARSGREPNLALTEDRDQRSGSQAAIRSRLTAQSVLRHALAAHGPWCKGDGGDIAALVGASLPKGHVTIHGVADERWPEIVPPILVSPASLPRQRASQVVQDLPSGPKMRARKPFPRQPPRGMAKQCCGPDIATTQLHNLSIARFSILHSSPFHIPLPRLHASAVRSRGPHTLRASMGGTSFRSPVARGSELCIHRQATQSLVRAPRDGDRAEWPARLQRTEGREGVDGLA
jgi:hypothetical protein